MPDVRSTDGVPAWMADHGIKKGEWFSMTKAQLKTQQRPDKVLKVRVWATGILHTAGYQGQEAFTMRNGKKVPLSPRDIIAELHAVAKKYFAGVEATEEALESLKETKDTVRRAMAELEADGICCRTDMSGKPLSSLTPEQLKRLHNGKVRYFFWLKPREATTKSVAQEWRHLQTRNDLREVGKIAPLPFSICKVLKVFGFEKPSKSQILDVTYQRRVERAYNAAKEAFVRQIEVDGESPLKVDDISPHVEVVTPRLLDVDTGSTPEVVTGRRAFERNVERNDEKAGSMQSELSRELARRKLTVPESRLEKIVEALGECSLTHFLKVLERRAQRGKIGTGLLTHLAEDARKEWDATREERQQQADQERRNQDRQAERDRNSAQSILQAHAAGEQIEADLLQWAKDILREVSAA